MIRVLIIDDEPLACELIQEYLGDFVDVKVIGFCHDGFDGLKSIQENQPDLVFLDVQMPKINGFEMLEILDNPPAIIFSTAFDQYAIKAFEANAVDYLLKPYDKVRFKTAVDKFLNNPTNHFKESKYIADLGLQQKEQNRIVLKDAGKIKIIPVKDIIHLEADDDYVKIYSISGKYLKKKTLQFYEDGLSKELFCRIHRSHLINLSFLERIEAYEKNSHIALLKDGSKIPISRSGFQKIKNMLHI
tara:strand:+ start:136065 stop:136799 length:735 start_codon:yes stop_codon:yes gene_type:complete